MYSIEIKQVTREQAKNREYKQVGQEDGVPIYDYVDEETTEEVTRTIYTQRVEEIDVKGVIDAVNSH